MPAWRRRKSAFQRFQRVFAVARFYRWNSILQRLFRLARQRLFPNMRCDFLPDSPGKGKRTSLSSLQKMAVLACRDLRKHPSHSSTNLAEGRLCLLNETRLVDDPFDWKRIASLEVPHLWRFHAHYHEFLLACIQDNNGKQPSCIAWSVLKSWMANHDGEVIRVRSDAWHPYCISEEFKFGACF